MAGARQYSRSSHRVDQTYINSLSRASQAEHPLNLYREQVVGRTTVYRANPENRSARDSFLSFKSPHLRSRRTRRIRGVLLYLFIYSWQKILTGQDIQSCGERTITFTVMDLSLAQRWELKKRREHQGRMVWRAPSEKHHDLLPI